MKEVRAYIESHRLGDVAEALKKTGASGFTAINAVGTGKYAAADRTRKVKIGSTEFLPCMKLEIICEDSMVDRIVGVLRETAWAGASGHGIVCVSAVETLYRINPLQHGLDRKEQE